MKRCLQMGLMATTLMGVHSFQMNRAHADDCSEKQEESDGNKKDYKTVIGADGRKVFVIEKAFVVCGKVPRPNVFYVIQATSINYEWENLKRNFLPKIRQSVKKAPF